MKYLDPHDQASETLVYHSAVIAQQQQDGLLSRPEAEVLDILHKMFSQERQEDAVAHRRAASDDLCVVLVRSGKVVSVLDLCSSTRADNPPAEASHLLDDCTPDKCSAPANV